MYSVEIQDVRAHMLLELLGGLFKDLCLKERLNVFLALVQVPSSGVYLLLCICHNKVQCIEISTNFFFCSPVVTMSRECSTNGQWSSVDFSSCTFSSANEPPFILIWLLLSTLMPVTQSSAAFASEVSYTIFECRY